MAKKLILLILVAAASVNLVGALGPELGFDALWYHLTIPKIYLMWGKIAYIPGGLLYYSAMPRLGELLFLLGGANAVFAHLVSWGAGIGATFLTYKLARKFGLSPFFSYLSSLIFYATPLVGWLSGSAYIDLIRTFFEILALYLVIDKKPLLAGVAIGLAISTKTLALGSLGILFIVSGLSFSLLVPAILISAPWFIWSYQATGFPFYPIGAGIIDTTQRSNFFSLFTEDKLNPLYLLAVQELSLLRKGSSYKILVVYCLLAFIYWLLTPQNGGGRFLLPYLPAWVVLVAITVQKKTWLIALVCVFAIGSIFYRSVANLKVLPYLAGRQSKTEYLCQHLDFRTAVFVDCDGWFKANIKPTDLVLIKGFHNLYYVDFPFVHETWYKGEKVDYVLEYKQDARSFADNFYLRSTATGQCLAGCNSPSK